MTDSHTETDKSEAQVNNRIVTKYKSACRCRLFGSTYDIAKRQSIMQTITLVKQLLFLKYILHLSNIFQCSL